jgi:hypothetical protein
MWAVPLVVGVSLIIWHRRVVDRQFAGRGRRLSAAT